MPFFSIITRFYVANNFNLKIAFLIVGLFFFWAFEKSAHSQSKKEIHSIHREAFQISTTKPDSSLNLLDKAKTKSIEINYVWGIAFTDYLTARTHMLSNHDALALQKFSEALNGFSKSDTLDLYNEYVMLWNMARIAYRNGSFTAATTYYDDARTKMIMFIKESPKLAKEKKALDKIENIDYFQALALKRGGKILEATSQLLNLLKSDKTHGNEARVKNQIGLIYKDLKNYPDAKHYFYEILSAKFASQYYKALANHNLGYIFMLENNATKSIEHFGQSIELCKDLLQEESSDATRRQLYLSYLDLGELYYRIDNFEKAINQWNEALKSYSNIGANPEHYIIHNWLLKAYLNSDPQMVKYHNEQYLAYNQEYIKTREAVSDLFKKELFENQIARFEQERQQEEKLTAQKKSLMLYLYILAGLSLLASILLLWYFKVYRKNRNFRRLAQVANWQAIPDSELPGKL